MDREIGKRRDGLWIFLAALAARVAWAVWAGRFWGYRDDGAYDDGVFLDMARGLLGRGPVALTHAPGYSMALAPFLALGEAGVSPALWAQMLLSAYTAVLARRLASALSLGRTAALTAGLFVAFHPMLVFFSARMMSESLFTALVVGFFLAWVGAWRTGSPRDAAWAGLLGGLASLTRPVMLPFGGALALVALWRRREQPRWAALVAVCGLVWAAALVPWTARNWAEHHRFAPVTVQGGWNFYEGLTVDPEEIRHTRARAMGEEARALGLSDPFARDEHFGAKARSWIRANTGAFLRLCAVKAARFWRLAPEPPHSRLVRLGAGVFTLALFAAALAGLPAAAAAPGVWFLFAWAAHLNLLHAVFASNLRYRLPLEPVLAVLAGAGLAALLRRRAPPGT